jgi:putative PIN family toxin of toxin-antitoxin system
MSRVVLDANVIISGTIAPLGASAAILDAWRAGRIEVITCPDIVREVSEKLRLPRIGGKYGISDAEIDALLQAFAESTELVPGTAAVDPHPTDPDDVMLFAAAIEANADFIVTGDAALLSFLWPGPSRIVSPRAFQELELGSSAAGETDA